MDVGVVAIRALGSNYYLAISRKGELYGAVSSCPFPSPPPSPGNSPMNSASLNQLEWPLNR